MKKLLLLISLLLCLAHPGLAAEIVVLKSSDIAPYAQVAAGFEKEFQLQMPALGLKAIAPHRFHEVVLDNQEGRKKLQALVDSSHADLILALGKKALGTARQFTETPVVYTLVVHPDKLTAGSTHITGINLTIPPALQFSEVKRILPQVQRVGVLYNPEHSEDLISQAEKVLSGYQLHAVPIHSAQELPALLDSLRDKIDLLWMIPDLTTTNRKTLPSYFHFSFKNKIPVLTFSQRYLKPGAALATSFDLEAIGQSAAEQASLILRGRPVAEVPVQQVPRLKTKVNQTIMKKLNLSIAGGGQ
ncbi:MAG: hypothetical protein H8E79_06695 [Desulfobulbaceae bacterium]|uniref:ABC transporter substrate-binding protein n=1 Tax=Candidatus Desulfatifera sulfidica TaxID=2841691 RepID=A0A8J6TE72_9BACT|nr:hypothetical protein [Candidatus Desulfatifera sulfidica]